VAEDDLQTSGAPPYRCFPHAKRSGARRSATWWQDRPWKWFGLTQSCKQVRAEYRPRWMSALSVRLTPTALPYFAATFLPEEGALGSNAPEVVQVPWPCDHHKKSKTQTFLTPLLQLKARLPAIRFNIVPSDYNCRFAHSSWHGWSEKDERRIRNTAIFEDFLANVNAVWIKDVLNRNVTIEHSIVEDTQRITFHIVCKESFCHGVGDTQAAWDLLNGWGVLGLSRKAEMDIVLVYEEVEKVILDGYEVQNSLLRKFRVPRIRTVAAA
jgi:hypothetical protein